MNRQKTGFKVKLLVCSWKKFYLDAYEKGICLPFHFFVGCSLILLGLNVLKHWEIDNKTRVMSLQSEHDTSTKTFTIFIAKKENVNSRIKLVPVPHKTSITSSTHGYN